jgi:AcrR family transcriptional regulator
MGARAEAVGQTRERILAAARDLFVAGDVERVTVDEIAAGADVARATVYQRFGSKLGVVEGLVEDLERRAGLQELVDVVEHHPPDGLVRAVTVTGCRYWATDPDLVRTVTALGRLQPEVAGMLAAHDSGRLRILERMVERLDAGGALSPGCPPAVALDVLWLTTSFDAYDLLATGRGLAPEAVAELLAAVVAARLT